MRIVFTIITVWAILAFIDSLGKYEGQSAKDWYYDSSDWQSRYQGLKGCIESYSDEKGEDIMRRCF